MRLGSAAEGWGRTEGWGCTWVTETLNSCLLRFQEKGNLEVLLFSIQSKLRAHNRRLFVPREGCGIWDIDKVIEVGDRGETRWHDDIVYRSPL